MKEIKIDIINKCTNLGKQFIGDFNEILDTPSLFEVNCNKMQSILNEVLYHTKIDNHKLTFRQFINWFLIPDDVTITDDYEQFILSLIENSSYCVEDAIITVLSNQKYKIEEFANSRQKIVYDCISLGKQFAHHFNKIMDEGIDSQYFNYHCDELQNFFSHVNNLKFKHNNKRLTTEDLIDYFFFLQLVKI